MRSLTLVLVLIVSVAFGGVLYSNDAATDLGEYVPTVGSPPLLPPEPRPLADVLYESSEYPGDPVGNGIRTTPTYGYMIVDDIILAEDSNIEKVTYWIIQLTAASGYVHRFYNVTSDTPGSELDNAPGTTTLTSTGLYEYGYLIYKMEAEIDYDIAAGHYFSGSWFTSGDWFILVTTNSYDIMAYFDQGGGGSGPWYSSQAMWGSAYNFFQIIEGTAGEPEYDPPYVTGMDPDDGEADVPLDSNIVFHCIDDEHDVDVDTIDFTAADTSLGTGRALYAGSPNRTLAGDFAMDETDPADIVCTFDPDDDYYEGDTITCTVAAGLADSKGNATEDDFVWTFDTEGGGSVTSTTWGAIKADF